MSLPLSREALHETYKTAHGSCPTHSSRLFCTHILLLFFYLVKSEEFFQYFSGFRAPFGVSDSILNFTKTRRANLFHTPARYDPIIPAMMNGDASKRVIPTKIKRTIIKARIAPKIQKSPISTIAIFCRKVVGIGCPLMVSQFIFIHRRYTSLWSFYLLLFRIGTLLLGVPSPKR